MVWVFHSSVCYNVITYKSSEAEELGTVGEREKEKTTLIWAYIVHLQIFQEIEFGRLMFYCPLSIF